MHTHKIAQKVTSVSLAISMLLSMFTVDTIAYADEFVTDSTAAAESTTEVTSSDLGEVDAGEASTVETVNETGTTNIFEDVNEPSLPDTDVVDSAADMTEDDTAMGEDVVPIDSDEFEDTTTETVAPETVETFVGLQTVTPDYGDRIVVNGGGYHS